MLVCVVCVVCLCVSVCPFSLSLACWLACYGVRGRTRNAGLSAAALPTLPQHAASTMDRGTFIEFVGTTPSPRRAAEPPPTPPPQPAPAPPLLWH
eukprot:COSAG02_NODE_21835_length_773_cov_1.399110_1_plen_94_part_10